MNAKPSRSGAQLMGKLQIGDELAVLGSADWRVLFHSLSLYELSQARRTREALAQGHRDHAVARARSLHRAQRLLRLLRDSHLPGTENWVPVTVPAEAIAAGPLDADDIVELRTEVNEGR